MAALSRLMPALNRMIDTSTSLISTIHAASAVMTCHCRCIFTTRNSAVSVAMLARSGAATRALSLAWRPMVTSEIKIKARLRSNVCIIIE